MRWLKLSLFFALACFVQACTGGGPHPEPPTAQEGEQDAGTSVSHGDSNAETCGADASADADADASTDASVDCALMTDGGTELPDATPQDG